MGFGLWPEVHEKRVFFCQPGHGEAAWEARWMLTPFPLRSSQCVAPTTLSRWGVSASSMTEMKWHSRYAEQKFTSCSVQSRREKIPSVFSVFFFFPGVLFFSIHNCLMMRSLSRDVHSAYLNRLPGFHSHSSAKKDNKHIFVRPYWLQCTNWTLLLGWMKPWM